MATLTFFPDAHVETTTVDGRVYLYVGNSAWADLHDAADGNNDTTTDSQTTPLNPCSLLGGVSSNTWAIINRGIFLFDISSLPAGVTITSAKLGFYVTDWSNPLSIAIGVVSSNPTSNTAIVVGDYNKTKFGTTRYVTDVNISNLTTSAYNILDLNAAGITFLQTAQSGDKIVKFGVRTAPDIDDSPPDWITEANSYVFFQMTEGVNKPYLEITYTREETGAYTSLPIVATIPSTTASYVSEQTADYTSLSIVATIPSITATFVATYTAVFSALSLILSIPSMVVRSRFWKYPTKNTATYTNKTKNISTYTQKSKNDTS